MDTEYINKELKIEEKQILADKYKTAYKKVQFINEIKNGLGVEIKKNPRPIIKKKSFLTKLKLTIKKIFTQF